MLEPRIRQAVELMTRFTERTGLGGDSSSRRYLWTDAFAVCNLLGFPGDGEQSLALAQRLVDHVHHALGRHRADDSRTGWISGLDAGEGEAHPTLRGLRIGKPLTERTALERFDERLEWDRDGQYFHYLTKWMHALDQLARATGQPKLNLWARELANAAYRAFTYSPRGSARRQMHWKMSIDLSRPLVASMGQHDPLDGWITCVQLDATAVALDSHGSGPDLSQAAADFASIIDVDALATGDPLGIGGLLFDAYRAEQLTSHGALRAQRGLLETLLTAALVSLQQHLTLPDLRAPASRRLGFRELGLAIGLAAVPLMKRDVAQRLPHGSVARTRLEQLARFTPLRAEIESFWLRPEHRQARTWLDHLDISDVMLATSLAPEGFLVFRPLGAAAQP